MSCFRLNGKFYWAQVCKKLCVHFYKLLGHSPVKVEYSISSSHQQSLNSDPFVARRSCAFSGSRSSLSLKKSIFLTNRLSNSDITEMMRRRSHMPPQFSHRHNMAVVSTRTNYTCSHSSRLFNVVIWRIRSDKEASWSRALSKYQQRPYRYRWLAAWAGYSCYNNNYWCGEYWIHRVDNLSMMWQQSMKLKFVVASNRNRSWRLKTY